MGVSPWFDTLQTNDQNWVVVPGSDLNLANSFPSTAPWMEDCVRTGSRRKGDYTIQEVLAGPWGTSAEACAISHARFGDQNSTLLWADTCPSLVDGAADLEVVGGSSVFYHYTNDPGAFPAGSDSAHMTVSTIAYGVWLQPVIENLQERGVLSFPDPPDYGYPADADVEWESAEVTIWKVEIADAAGTSGSDPESQYAVNHNRQPAFSAASWGAWQKGVLPGDPIGGVDSTTFASDPVAETAKTWHQLDVPSTITADYLNETYDYGVAAGPAEAFDGGPALTATRTASTGVIVKVYVRSPRFRFIYEGGPAPIRVLQRGKDGLVGSGTNVLRRGSMQGSLRTIGGQR